MLEAWYAILAATFIAFAITEGRNFGIGMLLHRVARSREERRLVRRAVGPLWSWHEVWLIVAGGTLFLAFPKVMATALSGYYLAVFVLLWCGAARGIALEFGPHHQYALWETFWDAIFALGSAMLALFMGAAFGNVLRGVPLGADGRMFLPFFTDFDVHGRVGILDWYTVAVGGFTMALLGAHGATYLALKTDGAVRERSLRLAKRLWIGVVVLLPAISVATYVVRPELLAGLLGSVAAWAGVAACGLGLLAALTGIYAGKETMAFTGASWCIAGLLGGAAAATWPVMLHSTIDPSYSMTAQAGAAGAYSLKVGLFWWPVAAALSLMYAWLISRRYRGKTRSD